MRGDDQLTSHLPPIYHFHYHCHYHNHYYYCHYYHVFSDSRIQAKKTVMEDANCQGKKEIVHGLRTSWKWSWALSKYIPRPFVTLLSALSWGTLCQKYFSPSPILDLTQVKMGVSRRKAKASTSLVVMYVVDFLISSISASKFGPVSPGNGPVRRILTAQFCKSWWWFWLFSKVYLNTLIRACPDT